MQAYYGTYLRFEICVRYWEVNALNWSVVLVCYNNVIRVDLVNLIPILIVLIHFDCYIKRYLLFRWCTWMAHIGDQPRTTLGVRSIRNLLPDRVEISAYYFDPVLKSERRPRHASRIHPDFTMPTGQDLLAGHENFRSWPDLYPRNLLRHLQPIVFSDKSAISKPTLPQHSFIS